MRLICVMLSLSSLFHFSCKRNTNLTRSEMIGNGVAVFYAGDYHPDSVMPSLALVQEPKRTGPLPEDWKTRVTFSRSCRRTVATVKIEPTTHLYGTGEVTGPLLRNGTIRELWNTDNYAYKKAKGNRLYQSHPWVLGVRADGTAFGVLSDHTYRQEIALGKSIRISTSGPAFRVIVIERNSPQEVMRALGELTGTIELPPLWSLGYHQCRYSYYPDSRVKEIADTFRLKQIPCDVIWVDIHYMDSFQVFTFSPERFPDPKAVNNYLHEKGFKSIWMIDPGVAVKKGYFVYDSGTEQDVWVKTKKGVPYNGEVWPGDCVFPDFTQPKTIAWWGDLYKDFMATGIDGVWNDMNEPAVFSEKSLTMPEDVLHAGGGELPAGTHARYHNVYGRLMVEASKKGIQAANPDKRPFVLTRSNHLGGQRFAATWTGDNQSTWKHLRLSVPMSLTLGLSGQPFSGPDIGGYNGDATPELFGHWIALGAFYPFSRAHTEVNSSGHEPWAFGKKIEDVSRVAITRRYRLLPYLYTLFRESSQTGMPVMRPVFFADVKDLELRAEEQAFLVGSDLLVIPQWAEQTALPNGEWRTVYLTSRLAEEDGYQPVIKIRPGAIVPLGPTIQNTTQYSLDTLTLLVSLNAAGTAEGSLYADAGEGYGYRDGAYSLTSFKAEKQQDKIVVTKTKTDGKDDLQNKVITVRVVTDQGERTFTGPARWPVTVQ